jgi:hypothetical protein
MPCNNVIVSSLSERYSKIIGYLLKHKYLTITVLTSLFLTTVAEVGKRNFEKSRETLPEALSIVDVGGYDNIYKLAADPKAELVKLVIDNLRLTGGSGTYKEKGKIDALVALLQSKCQGFSSLKVDGEWVEVLNRQGKFSTKSQKLIGRKKKTVRPSSNFDVKLMSFQNTVLTPRGNGVLKADVKVCFQKVLGVLLHGHNVWWKNMASWNTNLFIILSSSVHPSRKKF